MKLYFYMTQENTVFMNPFRDCCISFTWHVQQRSNERSLTSHDIKRVLREGKSQKLTNGEYKITHGALTVIGRLFRCNLVVITVYSD